MSDGAEKRSDQPKGLRTAQAITTLPLEKMVFRVSRMPIRGHSLLAVGGDDDLHEGMSYSMPTPTTVIGFFSLPEPLAAVPFSLHLEARGTKALMHQTPWAICPVHLGKMP